MTRARTPLDGRYGSILAVPTVARWWGSRTAPQRLDLYTRWSFYGWLALTPALALLAVAPAAARTGTAGVLLFLTGCLAVAALGIVVARAGLSASPRGSATVPRVRLAGLVVAALGTSAIGFVVLRGPDTPEAVVWGVGVPAGMALTACAPLWSSRVLGVAGAGVGVLVGVATAADGRPVAAAVVQAVSMTVAVVGVAIAFRFSVWVLDVVVEMERTRGVQLQLAVAEERLRFARDLHDVLGRDLSAIAVKSQLGAELVRRGRPGADDELAEISRIAEGSLREVRDVVRGYRTADLGVELAGARSVLRAAGVACTVTGEDAGSALPAPVQTALGWVVREAVTNVLRHSRAAACTIDLAVAGSTARLRVVNDGAGATGGAAGQGGDAPWGSGLTGLAERLSARDGRLTAGREGDRFVLTVDLPREEAP